MSQLFKMPFGEFTGDRKPTGKKIWRNISGSYICICEECKK